MLTFNDCLDKYKEIGYVESTSLPLLYVKGLPSVTVDEVVVFENGDFGRVLSLSEESVEVLAFSKNSISSGARVARSNKTLSVPVSKALLGNIVNPLGHTLVAESPVDHSESVYANVEADALNIDKRKKISEPLLSGVSVVDLMIPLGKGQRQLLLGDRKTGKTSFALQVLLNNARKDAICIYACIGKKRHDINSIENFLKENDVYKNSIIVASGANDPLGLISLTPYTAMAIGEYFRDQGHHVVIFLDDLTTHAKFHREISLLAKRFPGRDSYPGDTFYAHSRLLERAGYFEDGTSITCFPLASTVEGDISGYIQTNLMSMTDGHLFFDTELFNSGQRPAINQFFSVTRVGRQTQDALRWSVNRELNSFFALYNRTKNFVHFGAELNEGIKVTLELGRKVLFFFNQSVHHILGLEIQMFIIAVLWAGVWNKKNLEELEESITRVIKKYESDEEFKTMVDGVIAESTDLNVLLGKIMKDISYYNKYIY